MISPSLIQIMEIKLKTRLLVFFIWTISSFCQCSNSKSNTIEKLIDSIFEKQGYNPMVRPEGSTKTAETIINTELKILQIDLKIYKMKDEKYQELISIVWLEMTWIDPRFAWNTSEFNITDIILPVTRIWVPDIVLQNGVGKNEYLYDMKQFNPWISHTGLITWVPEIRIHTKCTISVRDFPFDTQRCEINFYSWAHTVKQMKLFQFENKNTTNITHLNQNTEWTVFHTCALNKTIVTSINLEWWTTSYVIFIKRRNYYHMFNLIVPYLILTVCSINLFLLPPETGEKISLAVSLLLTFFLNLAILSNYIPESSNELPIIATYYLFNIILISASLGASVCVLNLYFRTNEHNKPPIWLKKILGLPVNTKLLHKRRPDDRYYNETLYYQSKHEKNFNNDLPISVMYTFKDADISSLNSKSPTLTQHMPPPPPPPLLPSSLMTNSHQTQARSGILKTNKKLTETANTNVLKIHFPDQSIPIRVMNKRDEPKNFENFSKQLSENILRLFNDMIDGITKKNEELIIEKLANSATVLTAIAGSNEWREIGRRVDQVLFLISIVVVSSSQAVFFWKFYTKNLLPRCNACECENIF